MQGLLLSLMRNFFAFGLMGLTPIQYLLKVAQVALHFDQMSTILKSMMKPLPAAAGHADHATSTEQLPEQAPGIDVAIEVEKPAALGHG